MVNEPQKMPNLNTVIYRGYVLRRNKTPGKKQRKFGFPFSIGDFPLESMELPQRWFDL